MQYFKLTSKHKIILLIILIAFFYLFYVGYLEYYLPTDQFIKVMIHFFENHDICTVKDINGNDVTSSFYENNLARYKNHDFLSIKKYFLKNNLCLISW